MKPKIKITLDSENRENNEIIINGVDVTEQTTKVKIDWDANKIAVVTTDFTFVPK